jgi:hypothetical protein
VKTASQVVSLLFVTALLLALAGCATYQVGKPAGTPFRTVYIEPVANRSYAPQAQALLSNQVREHLMRDGRVRVVGPDEADAILSITLMEYSRDSSAVRADDTALASKFTMSMTAHCTLVDARNGRVYFRNRQTSTETDGIFGIDEEIPLQGLQSEYQTMPILTEKLARNIGNLVLHTW